MKKYVITSVLLASLCGALPSWAGMDAELAPYNQAIQANPRNAEAYMMRGFKYHTLGQYEKAIADYKRAIELDPNLVVAYTDRGVVYNDLE